MMFQWSSFYGENHGNPCYKYLPLPLEEQRNGRFCLLLAAPGISTQQGVPVENLQWHYSCHHLYNCLMPRSYFFFFSESSFIERKDFFISPRYRAMKNWFRDFVNFLLCGVDTQALGYFYSIVFKTSHPRDAASDKGALLKQQSLRLSSPLYSIVWDQRQSYCIYKFHFAFDQRLKISEQCVVVCACVCVWHVYKEIIIEPGENTPEKTL